MKFSNFANEIMNVPGNNSSSCKFIFGSNNPFNIIVNKPIVARIVGDDNE